MSTDPFRGLFREGVHWGGRQDRADTPEAIGLKVRSAGSLADLSDEYEFYTPAIIHVFIPGLNRDPYQDFLAEQNADVRRISLKFDRPVFSGLGVWGDKDWNHVLYGLEKSMWPAFCGFMGTIAFLHRDSNLMNRVRTQELSIADPIAAERAGYVVPGRIATITAFVLDSTAGCRYFVRGKNYHKPPAVRYDPKTFEDTADFAKRLLHSEDPNPYSANGDVEE